MNDGAEDNNRRQWKRLNNAGLFVAAVVLAALARRVGAPYPVFLALGGALLAFVPGAPSITLPPELALAIFVAPILLDAAFDASLRDSGTTGRR